ncbi:MAG: hypothetical protein KAW12_07785, partial [Candidatus Aminicenantes bacterium]|nr:hypothetical protein [Candidatus Aminicenantes bacterium]
MTLEPANEITVKLNSKPGSFVFIDIYKFIAKPTVSFSASPSTISYKQSSTLSWNVNGADSVTIDNGIGSVVPGGSMAVSPQVPNTTYTLTAANLGGTTTAAATVTVIFPPPRVSFSASRNYIQPGSSVTLTWATEVAQTVTIEPGFGSVDLTGSMPVTPAESTTFRLYAVGYGGAVAAEAAVIVDGTAPQVQITSHEEGAVVREIPISLSGTFVEDYLDKIVLNNTIEATIDNKRFSFANLTLSEGDNLLTVTAVDRAGNSASTAITLTYMPDSEPPQIHITSP